MSGKGSGLTKPMKLSAELAAIVGKKEASRAECIKLLWAYLKEHNLQDPANKQFFTPDAKMAKVFGKEKIRAFSMSKHIGSHLSPM
jgi:upstream activation factor subunit UAF30